MESFAGVKSHPITSKIEPPVQKSNGGPAVTAVAETLDQPSITYHAFTYQAEQQRRWVYPAVAIGILVLLAISIPTLLRLAGPGLARAASISKLSHTAPPASQDSAYAPEFGPTNYSASPNDTTDGQALTVVAMPQQTLRDVVLQHGGRFDDAMVRQIRALNPQLNPDQIEPGQLIRIPQPAGTWQKSFDSSDTAADATKPAPAASRPTP
jgi:hypothetical protein